MFDTCKLSASCILLNAPSGVSIFRNYIPVNGEIFTSILPDFQGH